MQHFVSVEDLPDYHENLLIVKMMPSAQSQLAAPRRGVRGVSADRPEPSAGISALEFYERGGMIKRVTPVSRTAAPKQLRGGMRAMATMATSLSEADREAPGLASGVNVIEMLEDNHVDDLRMALARDPNVEFVSRVARRYVLAAKKSRPGKEMTIVANAPNLSQMWNLKKIKWQDVRSRRGIKDAIGIKVAVLDTGIDVEHPDLKGQIKSYSFANLDLSRPSGDKDIIGHGTHVAGTIAAKINNNLGINGVCNCDLRIWKIFDDVADYISMRSGYAYFVDPIMYFRALADCIEQQVDVVNLSIGGGGAPDAFESSLFANLIAGGTTVVAAMGNEREYGSPTSYPAAIPGVIAVGATKIDDKVASFSNRGNHISISAPGVGIWSTLPQNPGQFGFRAERGSDGRPREGKPLRRETDYDAWDGTSMATPHVAAAAALLIANRGKMSPADVNARLKSTAYRVKSMKKKTFHPDYGAGRLDLLKLLTS